MSASQLTVIQQISKELIWQIMILDQGPFIMANKLCHVTLHVGKIGLSGTSCLNFSLLKANLTKT